MSDKVSDLLQLVNHLRDSFLVVLQLLRVSVEELSHRGQRVTQGRRASPSGGHRRAGLWHAGLLGFCHTGEKEKNGHGECVKRAKNEHTFMHTHKQVGSRWLN